VQRWGVGLVQEIDSAAMHLFARWQHLDLDLNATDGRLCNTGDVQTVGYGAYATTGCFVQIGVDKHKKPIFIAGEANKHYGKGLGTSFEGLDIFQIGGVIFF
jgi:hypothetical protein